MVLNHFDAEFFFLFLIILIILIAFLPFGCALQVFLAVIFCRAWCRLILILVDLVPQLAVKLFLCSSISLGCCFKEVVIDIGTCV